MDERALRINARVTIPAGELRFQFSRSGGPGGQHVNKTATQAELIFDVKGSPSLSPEHKQRIRSRLRGYLSKEGVLRLTCQATRSQAQNRQEALDRLQALLARALLRPKPRKPTRPTRASKERRLAAKKRRSDRKRQRQVRPDDL
jgi:ribosome-associated protein